MQKAHGYLDVARRGALLTTLAASIVGIVFHARAEPSTLELDSGELKIVLDIRDSTDAERFVGAGRIRSVASGHPSRHWLYEPDHHAAPPTPFYGLPDEFEQPILIGAPTGPEDTMKLFKLGIGLFEGMTTAEPDLWRDMRPVEPTVWRQIEIASEDASLHRAWRQTWQEPNGTELSIEREIELHKGSPAFTLRYRLHNTGSQPIATTWYPHPCFAPESDNTYGKQAWATVPLLLNNDDAIDTEPVVVPRPEPLIVWGALPGAVIAEPWFAVGNGDGGIWISRLDRQPAWVRFWTDPHTFAVEPFITLDTPPGATDSWSMLTLVLDGADRIDAVGEHAALALERGEDHLIARFFTFQPHPLVKATVRLLGDGHATDTHASSEIREAPCGPNLPLALRLPTTNGELHVETTLEPANRQDKRWVVRRRLPARHPPTTDDVSRTILVLTQPQADGRPQDDIGYLPSALRAAGHDWSVLSVDEGWKNPDPIPDIVFVPGPVKLHAAARDWLRGFLHAGGGLVHTAPFALAETELGELLPAHPTGLVFSAPRRPYGPNRRMLNIPDHRLHLVAEDPGQPPPELAGRPLWPTLPQDIGRAWEIEAHTESSVPLRFAAGSALDASFNGAPAVVHGAAGKGRIVLAAMPLAWGMPPVWINDARFGEYHRRLISALFAWAVMQPPA